MKNHAKINKVRKARTRHALRRALERYDLHLSQNILEELVSKIRNNKYVPVERLTNTRHSCIVVCADKLVCVVYHQPQKQISTFLPMPEKIPGVSKTLLESLCAEAEAKGERGLGYGY